jgi:hypothetical protein
MRCHLVIPAALLLALSATAAATPLLPAAPAAPPGAPPAALAGLPRPAAPPAAAPVGDAAVCRAAIRQVERGTQIPPQLLAAIARVESGRRDPQTGQFGPWPWTINAEGQGRFFATRAEAIAEVRALQARGVRSMDVGCMQINLLHHPNAFPSLEAAFDPLTNVTYAAKFLTELQATRNNWTQAAANYHSNTPEFAQAYLRRIQAAWPEETRLATAEQRDGALASWSQARAAGQFVPGGAPMLTNAPAARTEGLRGRGLDSYREQPVMPGRMGLGAGLRRL